MSLHILNAHSGVRLDADPVTFVSIEALKSWIGRASHIDADRQILMTAQGRQVKLHTLLVEKEIFVYDRQLLATKHDAPKHYTPPDYTPSTFTPEPPPDSLTNEIDLQAWQDLFRDRKAWAFALAKSCERILGQIGSFNTEAAIVHRGTAIAVKNLKQHIETLRSRNDEAQVWARSVLQDQAFVLEKWEAHLDQISSIPARKEIGRFLLKNAVESEEPSADARLSRDITFKDLIDVRAVKKSGLTCEAVSQRLANNASDLTDLFEDVVHEANQLFESFGKGKGSPGLDSQEQAGRLRDEVKAITNKASSDYDQVLGLPSTQKSIAHVSKIALLHTRTFLPSLLETSLEIDSVLRHSIKRKEETMVSALQYLKQIGTLESTLVSINSHLASLDIGDEGNEAFDLLASVINLPLVYGSILVEAIKRREWREKMTADSSTLAEVMATLKDDEERRRKKWSRGMTNVLRSEAVEEKALGVEVNIQLGEHRWPHVDRQDVAVFVQHLRSLGGYNGIVAEIEELARTLDEPLNKPFRKVSTFRNGSIHESSYERKSLFLHGNDDLLKGLTNEKTKLEDRLRSSESRVRKLEDLLHRQSQLRRKPSFGSSRGFDDQSSEREGTSSISISQNTSPKPQDALPSRPITSRRFSANTGADEKRLVQRIVSLEAELNSQKQISTSLQNDVNARCEAEKDLRSQVEDAVSTKRDIMANMESQQHEFEDERRLLDGEISKWRLRVEDVEEELDRALGSRHNEEARSDERVQILEAELERVREVTADQVRRADLEVGTLREYDVTQREMSENLSNQVRQQEERNARLEAKVKEMESNIRDYKEIQEDQLTTLKAAHLRLSGGEKSPENFTALVEAVGILAERSDNVLHSTKTTCETVRAENLGLEQRLRDAEQSKREIESKVITAETAVSELRHSLTDNEARLAAVVSDLEDERHELQKLQAKVAAGETGSEALRSRITDEEIKYGKASSNLAAANAQVKNLSEVSEDRLQKLKTLQDAHSLLEMHHESRASHAEEISTRLSLHNDRLVRLLEQLGHTVSKPNESIVIERVAKTVSASTTINDLSKSMTRSTTGPLSSQNASEERADAEGLDWARASDLDEEAQKFIAYIRHVNQLNLDSFSEAIIRRVKESEHVARRWQKEARVYRDRAHRAQSEAHEKIAFRSFKEGDLALFLPTRNQATRPWAAFNVGAPHYFLREQDSHKLQNRDWLVARISKVEERVVDLSKSMSGLHSANDRRSVSEASDGNASFDDENPFELSDGLRWYLLDAMEEKPGAPTTPGLGKSTVAAANVDAQGSSIRVKQSSRGGGVAKTLTKSLDSRRDSTNSKKSAASISGAIKEPAINADVVGPPQSPYTVLQADEHAERRPSSSNLASEEGRGYSSTSHAKFVQEGANPVQSFPQRSKGSKAWESLWSIDLNIENGKGKK